MKFLIVSLLVCLSTSAFAGSFVAIAWSPSTNTWGYWRGSQTQIEAESTAKAYCAAADCVVAAASNAYLALATSSDGSYAWGWSPTEVEAKFLALEYCGNVSTAACKIAVVTGAFQ